MALCEYDQTGTRPLIQFVAASFRTCSVSAHSEEWLVSG